MTDASDLFTAVTASYDSDGLITLTNIRDRSATAIDTTAGDNAAQGVIDLWPAFCQEDYDGTNATHLEVAKEGVIAILWRRGGSSTSIEQVKFDSVFSADGLISKIRRTGPRGRQGPNSNSGVSQAPEATSGGGRYRGWSDRESLPVNYMPRRTSADG